MKNSYILLLLFLIPAAIFSQTTLNISVSGIRNKSGNIRLAFYNSTDSYDDNKPMFIKIVPKSDVVKGKISATYTLKPGTYGIAILDDENANNKMDYGIILPNEGFGFSDYYHTGMSKPVFNDFKFTLKNEVKAVQIKVRYL